ncbi:MAG TPA: site-2 protease family protein [Anaerolineaceae bacterium]|nr:site-2 protease family protein [Anaerolineaceae bacterium]
MDSNYDYPEDDFQPLHDFLRAYMVIESITIGKKEDKWKFRYVGKIKNIDQSELFFDQIEKKAKEYKLTPLVSEENSKHHLYFIEEIPETKKSSPKTNIILFIITLFSVLITGGLFSTPTLPEKFNLDAILLMVSNGWPFAVAILSILGAHEMGHYIAGRIHRVNVTLPYFIPLPIISPFGTMGAFINMKSIPKNKKQLFDIAIAGPLSGIVVAIPIIILGLSLSHVELLPPQIPVDSGLQMEGNSLLYLGLKYLVFGELLPQPQSYEGLHPIIYWLRYIFTGKPFPFGGLDVMIHPVAWAGWAGILVTSLNLIPIGQLDGGHILTAVFGKKARKTMPFFLLLMGLLGFAWSGWWFWAFILIFLGQIPSQMKDSITPLDPLRKKISILMLILFVLVFTPVPLVILMG